jgi:hypothetical protein
MSTAKRVIEPRVADHYLIGRRDPKRSGSKFRAGPVAGPVHRARIADALESQNGDPVRRIRVDDDGVAILVCPSGRVGTACLGFELPAGPGAIDGAAQDAVISASATIADNAPVRASVVVDIVGPPAILCRLLRIPAAPWSRMSCALLVFAFRGVRGPGH